MSVRLTWQCLRCPQNLRLLLVPSLLEGPGSLVAQQGILTSACSPMQPSRALEAWAMLCCAVLQAFKSSSPSVCFPWTRSARHPGEGP